MKASLIKDRGGVEDMRGKTLLDRSIFRYGRWPLSRMRSEIPGRVSEAVTNARMDNMNRVLTKFLFDLRTENATKEAKNAGEMNARRTFRYTDEARRTQEELDAQRATEAKYFKEANAIAAEALQKRMNRISEAFLKAIVGKSLIGRKP